MSHTLHMQACRKRSKPVGYGLAKGDVKLLFVPLIFFLLRIWTSIIDTGLHYTHSAQQITFKCSLAAAVFAVLSVSSMEACVISVFSPAFDS